MHTERTSRILVIASETADGLALSESIRRSAARHDRVEVLVVSPALNSRLRHWTSDTDKARSSAEARLERCLRRLRKHGIVAHGCIGDAEPLLALHDALAQFPADEIIVSTHPPGASNWLERDVVERARAETGRRVIHVYDASLSLEAV